MNSSKIIKEIKLGKIERSYLRIGLGFVVDGDRGTTKLSIRGERFEEGKHRLTGAE